MQDSQDKSRKVVRQKSNVLGQVSFLIRSEHFQGFLIGQGFYNEHLKQKRLSPLSSLG